MRGVGDTETHLRVSGLEAKLSLQTSRPESTAPSHTRQGPGIWPGCTQARGATWVWTAWTSATSAGTPARFEPLGSSCAPRGPSGQVRTGTPGTVSKCHLEENATMEPDLSLQPHVSSRVPGCGREPKIPKPAQRSLTPGTGYAASATSWRWGRGKGPTKGKPKPCST